MIYLNSQEKEGGATQFVDAALSKIISEQSGYIGLVFQRKSFADMMKSSIGNHKLDPVASDPPYYSFSPNRAGSGVWFCPSRCLHRGVSPTKGKRHVLAFSFSPLPAGCNFTADQCVDQSVKILRDKINKGFVKSDVNPYWVSGLF